ncbi:hypothetical protein CCMA1212_003664 [Trichoderma ghanense]|uniref:RIN4 pathogenic type III effector avirulence factor Avr cleavage site domain-containing protein n=1 Tax=Trichoderma ghanense TaxID=65468 RepID=A0ABY2H934_9HYPO
MERPPGHVMTPFRQPWEGKGGGAAGWTTSAREAVSQTPREKHKGEQTTAFEDDAIDRQPVSAQLQSKRRAVAADQLHR